MSSDLVRKRLIHIRDNIGHARDFIAALDFDAFAADQKTVYATMPALEIISEASRLWSASFLTSFPASPEYLRSLKQAGLPVIHVRHES
jgi:uncharacterized protein with HEPN domain